METRIYYIKPGFDFCGKTVEQMSEFDLRMAIGQGVTLYSAKHFEEAFNLELISDLGYIRIFTTK